MTKPFRILTYNLECGGRRQLEAIYQVLAATQADVIALTEADDPDVVAELATRLQYHHVWAPGSGNRHIATLSRYPITRWQIYNRPPLTQAALETAVSHPAGLLTIYNVHLLPFLLLPFEIRRWQAIGKLLTIIRQKSPGRHLIVGDLNAIAPGDRVLQKKNPARMRRLMWLQGRLIFRLAIPRLLHAGYTDCFRKCHPGEDGFTWWTINPTTRYDYIFADATMTQCLQRCEVVTWETAVFQASDHFPLLADFQLCGQ
ncbi:MAG: endonuclease/exonuclease/phosphatase family protein [Chloroflexi bacterium]|nr:MAG: endonuclease/exonuclease/phosphatase family protein [Chloroflexota bacterium]